MNTIKRVKPDWQITQKMKMKNRFIILNFLSVIAK